MTTLDDSVERAKQVLINAATEITDVLMEDFSARYGHEMPPLIRRSFQVLLEDNLRKALLESTQEILTITREVKAEQERRQ